MSPRSLSEGNALQRRYAAWAAPHYARMPPAMRSEVERIDRWLYSRAGLVFWGGLAAATMATTAGLVAAGLPAWLALVCSLVVWFSLPTGVFGAWVRPERFTAARLARLSAWVVLGGYAGTVLGFLVGRVSRHGSLQTETLFDALRGAAWQATPILLAIALGVLLLLGGVAHGKRVQLQRELHALQLVQERDSAARQAAQAQLKLLQAQIQPHFIFNTLAAVQHWVDTADPRAGPLLRSLTAFLRGSTELLGREQSTLGDEVELVRHYLEILQARLGQRLRYRIEIAPALTAETLPPGLLLTLVENAVEHGVAPALAGAALEVRAEAAPDGWILRVRDDGAGLQADWHEGVGLANCRQRLQHHFGDRAALSVVPRPAGTEAAIRVRHVTTGAVQTDG